MRASRRVEQIKFFTRVFTKVYKTANARKLINAIKNRSNLRKAMREARKITRRQQAHHIIPVEAVKQCPIVQKAILEGFEINGLKNGAPLSLKKHKERHAEFENYNRFALGQLLDLESRHPDIDGVGAKREVEAFAKLMAKYFD